MLRATPNRRRTLIRAALAAGAALLLVGGIIAFVVNTGAHAGQVTSSPPGSLSSTSGGFGVDIACGMPTAATSTADSADPPSNATDCDAGGAGWLSAPGGLQSIQVNLGSTFEVSRVTVVWGADYAVRFKVRTSSDGVSWHTTNAVTGSGGGTQTITLPAGTTTQWVQLYLEEAAVNRTFGVDRLQVFSGSAAAGAAPAASAAPVTTGTAPEAAATAAAPGGVKAMWTGQFSGYGTAAWKSAWGYTPRGQFGQADLSEVSDPTAPGGGSALRVYYGAGSSANSCKDCPNPGGGQFYQQLSGLGGVGTTMANSETLDLKYSIKLPAGWDFGKAGKLPGLYGGVIGQESGGNHGADGWSTRYMFRNHGGAPNAGEIYLYTPTNSGPTGYGVDYFGNWNWTADGAWHTVEQLVNRQTGSVTVWFDGREVLNEPGIATGISAIPFSGVFFSTFFGGHDTTWGPKVAEYAYFADFSLSTTIQH
jgi:F5/8 type C domain